MSEIPDPTAAQSLLTKFQRAVGRYSRVMLAKVDDDDQPSIERFRKAVEIPIDRYRTRTTRDGEVEPIDPSEPSEPIDPSEPAVDHAHARGSAGAREPPTRATPRGLENRECKATPTTGGSKGETQPTTAVSDE